MIVNKKALIEAAPIKHMLSESHKIEGRSFGLSHAGYDIRLKQRIEYTPAKYIYLNPEQGYSIRPPMVKVDSSVFLESNFCIASAIEEFDMPNNLIGVVHDKSTNARLGISVFNTVIEPSWKGFLTLEIVFHGNEPIVLEAGTPVAQVIFHTLTETSEYNGKYQNQNDEPVKAIMVK